MLTPAGFIKRKCGISCVNQTPLQLHQRIPFVVRMTRTTPHVCNFKVEMNSAATATFIAGFCGSGIVTVFTIFLEVPEFVKVQIFGPLTSVYSRPPLSVSRLHYHATINQLKSQRNMPADFIAAEIVNFGGSGYRSNNFNCRKTVRYRFL